MLPLAIDDFYPVPGACRDGASVGQELLEERLLVLELPTVDVAAAALSAQRPAAVSSAPEGESGHAATIALRRRGTKGPGPLVPWGGIVAVPRPVASVWGVSVGQTAGSRTSSIVEQWIPPPPFWISE